MVRKQIRKRRSSASTSAERATALLQKRAPEALAATASIQEFGAVVAGLVILARRGATNFSSH
jgi:hypothetical protein